MNQTIAKIDVAPSRQQTQIRRRLHNKSKQPRNTGFPHDAKWILSANQNLKKVAETLFQSP